jgi:putative membrane protein
MAYHYLQAGGAMPHHWFMYWIVNWLLSAVALLLVGNLIKGIEVRGFGAALIATVIIGLVDVFIGPIVRFITFPFAVLTLGLFRFLVNGFLLKLASMFTPGFRVDGCLAAVLGSLVLTILTTILHSLAWATL